MTEPSNELDAAVAAERQRRQQQLESDEEQARAFEVSAARIYDALRAALDEHPGQPTFDVQVTQRVIPAQTRTVQRQWPLPTKIVQDPARVVEERTQVPIGRAWSVTVKTREADAHFRWRDPRSGDWAVGYKFTYTIEIRDDGTDSFHASLQEQRIVSGFTDQVGNVVYERDWRESKSISFASREDWLRSVCKGTDDGDARHLLTPDARLADEILSQIARAIA